MYLKKFLTPIILVFIIFASSCGKKGDPTLKAFEKPAAVINIKAIHQDNEINIFWQYPEAEKRRIKGCQFMRSEGTNSNFKVLAFMKPTEQSYLDKDFTFGNDYYYKIRCLSLKDIYSDDSPIIKVSALPPPPKPIGISYTITSDSLKIQWQEISDVKYNIYRSYQRGVYSIYPINNAPLKDNFYFDRIDTSRTVYYKISSHLNTEVRNESVLSEELEINPTDFIPSAPTGLIYAPLDKKILLLWEENPETWVKGYRIYRKKAQDKEFALIGEVINPVFIDSEPPDKKAIYHIKALGPVKEGQPSQTLIFEPTQGD